MEAYDRRAGSDRTWHIVDTLSAIATGRGISSAQVALAWLADRPAVTSVILGARSVEQLVDNLGMADLHQSSDELARLDSVSAPVTADYPYGAPGLEQRSRQIAGGSLTASRTRSMPPVRVAETNLPRGVPAPPQGWLSR
nr:aldo/keto reductase [Nakamurella sp. PAMC28650]